MLHYPSVANVICLCHGTSVFLLIEITFTMLYKKDNQFTYHQIQQVMRLSRNYFIVAINH